MRTQPFTDCLKNGLPTGVRRQRYPFRVLSARGHLVRFGLEETKKVGRVWGGPVARPDDLSGRDVRAPLKTYRQPAAQQNPTSPLPSPSPAGPEREKGAA